MKIGNLEVTFHRTVRVADGRQPSNLPPSLGQFELYEVEKYRSNCPDSWESGYFLPMHDVEAMWMSFQVSGAPAVAFLIGAGGVNAITGQKLGMKLEKENYVVCPPQPWLDGFKSDDGCVYQFVSMPHKKGEGNTVAEQLIRKDSLTGGIGIAVFDAKEPEKLKAKARPQEKWGDSAYGDTPFMSKSYSGQSVMRGAGFSEMGLGKGGKIVQKIYLDPHGLEVWKESPAAVTAIYLVDAKTFSEITSLPMPPLPKDFKSYEGKWFGLADKEMSDVAGSEKFTGLKSVFTGDTANITA